MHAYDPTCGCPRCDPCCPGCGDSLMNSDDTCARCGFDLGGNSRERGDDDGVEYGDPREFMEGL
jgi:predicted amidophosphoribosyltransferase